MAQGEMTGMNERDLLTNVKNLKKHISGNVLMRLLSLLSYSLLIYGIAVLLEAVQAGHLNAYIELLVLFVALGALGLRWFTNRMANRMAYAAQRDICDQLQDQIFARSPDSNKEAAASALHAVTVLEQAVFKDIPDRYYEKAGVVLLTLILSLSDWRAALILFCGAVILQGKVMLEEKNNRTGNDVLNQMIAAFFYIVSVAVALSHYANGMPLASALLIVLLGSRFPIPHKRSSDFMTAYKEIMDFPDASKSITAFRADRMQDPADDEESEPVTFKDLDASLDGVKKDISKAQNIKTVEFASNCLTSMSACLTVLKQARITWLFLTAVFMIFQILFCFWSKKQQVVLQEKMRDREDSIQAYAAVYQPQKTGFTAAGALMAAIVFQRNFLSGLLTVACVIVIGIVIPFLTGKDQADERRLYEKDQRIVDDMILSHDPSYEEERATAESDGLYAVIKEDAVSAGTQALADLFLIMEMSSAVMLYTSGNMNLMDILITLGISISLFQHGIQSAVLKETAFQALYDFKRKG